MVARIPRALAHKRWRDSERSDAVSAAYQEDRLAEEESKRFDGQLSFKAWGNEIDGGIGRSSAPVATRRELFRITASLIKFGWATKKVLEQTLGLYAAVLLSRRECFGVFHHLYTYANSFGSALWRRLPHFVLDELVAAALHLAVAFGNLRAPLSTRVYATDATPSRGGGPLATRRASRAVMRSISGLKTPLMAFWIAFSMTVA